MIFQVMGITEVIYAACFVSFLALIALMLLRGRSSWVGAMLLGAGAINAVWAANLAVPNLFPDGLNGIFDSLRLSGWVIFAVALVALRAGRKNRLVFLPLFSAVAFAAVLVGIDVGMLIEPLFGGQAEPQIKNVLHVGLSVGGLLAVENLLRNIDEQQRRKLWPLCLALGAMFAFELFMYAERLMVPAADPTLPEGRGIVGFLAVPLIALAIVRNREWRIDIHVSRAVVLHTATLLATGAFFLCLSAIGIIVRQLGGGWGPALQLLMLTGSAVVLVAVLGGRELRLYLKQFVSRNFFSHRFDYRAEWLRFVDTVSNKVGSEDNLPVRVIRALAQIIDSPAGTLWSLGNDNSYSPEIGWNSKFDARAKISNDQPIISGFRNGERIQILETEQEIRITNISGPAIAIPLVHNGRMGAFVILPVPTRNYQFDQETFDLLNAAGKQAASYLAEERSTRALIDSRLLTDFSKRFAFVVHDVKNLASQLSLTLSNAKRHIHNPEFREDMLRTLDDSVNKMNRLIGELHGKAVGDEQPKATVPDIIIATIAQDFQRSGAPIETRLGAPECTVAMDADELRTVLHHLMNNASEASTEEGSQPGTCIVVSSQRIVDKISIEVSDNGPGMDEEFVRNELFRPFRSTKSSGLGIGAYQAREMLRMSGGDLEVISGRGAGTTMRITLPVELRHRSAA
jgi:putative PEP-CTERM system histidine kinase